MEFDVNNRCSYKTYVYIKKKRNEQLEISLFLLNCRSKEAVRRSFQHDPNQDTQAPPNKECTPKQFV